MRSISYTKFAVTAIALPTLTHAHTWVESLRNIASNGSFVGEEGFQRGFKARSDPDFNDLFQTYQIENGHGPNPTLCNHNSQGPKSQGKYPRLKATPGSPVAILYQENGHVTLPDTNLGKPANRGTVFIYATQQGKDDEKYFDVYQKWNDAGTGGDKRGRLISTQNFDDGQCFQVNGGPISKERKGASNFQPSNPMGADLWCQNDIVIPADVDTSKLLTLYWVWKWDTAPNIDPADVDGKNQTYTSCMDVELQPANKNKAVAQLKYAQGQNVQHGAVPKIFEQLGKGNVFVEKHVSNGGSEPSGISGPTSSTTSLESPSAPVQSTASASATGCAAAPVQTVFVFGTSTGVNAPTGQGLSFSTAGSSPRTETTLTTTTTNATTSVASIVPSAQPTNAPGNVTFTASTAPAATIPVSQISDGQVQAPAPTNPPAVTQTQPTQAPSAAPTSIADNPVVEPVPVDTTASFPVDPSSTSTVTFSSAAPSVSDAVTASTPSTMATSAVASTPAPTSAGSARPTGSKCKRAGVKRDSKVFISPERLHARQWQA